jgi:hypothetical protein
MTPRFVFAVFAIAFVLAVAGAAVTMTRHLANNHAAVALRTT